MTNIISIDPGSAGEGNACAAFTDGTLIHVWFERAPAQSFARMGTKHIEPTDAPSAGWADIILVEKPEFQGKRSLDARPIDLINLSWSGALLAGRMSGLHSAGIIELPPSVWKGSEPKPANHRRLWQVLEFDEREILGGMVTEAAIMAACRKGALCRWSKPGAALYPKSFVIHNKLDAVAICKFFTRQLKKVG